MRELASTASEALRSLLHESLCGISVPDLDGLLVELGDTAFRVSELAERIDRALGLAVEAGGLRLDWQGQQRYSSPEVAVSSARADLRHGAAAARETGRWLDDARQVTATVGLAFDEDDDGIEEPY
jgi:hypothetical protein